MINLTVQKIYPEWSYTYDYELETVWYGTCTYPHKCQYRISHQQIPNAQQYPDVSSMLRENEQLRSELTNCRQIIASHQLLPPKATPHVSYLQCSPPQGNSVYTI